jgi:hypothetical protein
MAPMGMAGKVVRVAVAALATTAVACGDGDGAGTAQPTGSSLLVAEDGEAAVRALLAEASGQSGQRFRCRRR